jgi:hypothetical protein
MLRSANGAAEIQMDFERYFAGEVAIILAGGSRVPATITADEARANGKEIYRISFQQGADLKVADSEIDFFEALTQLRQELEKAGALLCCFGASEDVYPSGMQRSMGPAMLAYKMRMGFPSARQDIVNIFEADETVNPSTVAQQRRYHRAWADSLKAR